MTTTIEGTYYQVKIFPILGGRLCAQVESALSDNSFTCLESSNAFKALESCTQENVDRIAEKIWLSSSRK